MWTYKQSTGELFHHKAGGPLGTPVAKGYSGWGKGKNNPKMQGERAMGPIPRGEWLIAARYDSNKVGPFTLKLMARDVKMDDIHQPTKRSAFRVHGDNARGDASRGCIIVPRHIREQMWANDPKDRVITVIE